MPANWKTVPVFISSTFRDMQAERDHLVRFVFPRLCEQLLPRRIDLVAVDLRWGVTSEQNALGVCREVIDDCRPRLLCLLGGRYGWVPPGQTHSITADEVRYGVLDRPLNDRGYAYFYFRDDAATAAMLETTPGEFREPPDSYNQAKLTELKRAIVKAGLTPFTYGAKWDNDSRRLTGLKPFGHRVYADVLSSMTIDPELRDRFAGDAAAPLDEFAMEAAAMEAFVAERSGRFVLGERKTVLEELVYHACSASGNGYLCLTGAPGSGKSALLAHLSQHSILRDQPSSVVIQHFVGASPGSTDVRRTLRRLCHEVYVACDLEHEKQEKLGQITGNGEKAQKARRDVETKYAIPDDPYKLQQQFPRLLEKGAFRKPIVILIDALEQFDPTSELSGLCWLPDDLPANVRVICSVAVGSENEPVERRKDSIRFTPAISASDRQREPEGRMQSGRALEELRRRPCPPKEIELKPLLLADAEAIMDGYLARYRKRLDAGQRRALLAKSDARTPLYLLTALEELRTLGTHREITSHIAELPSTSYELFIWILERLENDDGFRDATGRRVGRELVSCFAALLVAARYGLSQRELTDLLDAGDPQGNIAALLQLLRPYLMRRGELLDFYHRQFRTAAEDAWLNTDARRRMTHEELAGYFRRRADPAGDGTWTAADSRGLSELPYHLTASQSWGEVHAVLTEVDFVAGKSRAGMIDDLLADYSRAEQSWPNEQSATGESAPVQAYAEQLAQHALAPDRTLLLEPPKTVELRSRQHSEPRDSDWTPLMRLGAWHRLVANHVAEFKDESIPAFQIAYNDAQGSPPAEDMESRLSKHPIADGYWLRRVSRPAWAARPACLHTLETQRDQVSCVALGYDGRFGVSAGWDRDVHLWDLNLGMHIGKLMGHTKLVNCIAATLDLGLAVSGDAAGTIIVWDLKARRRIRAWLGHTDRLYSEQGHTDAVNSLCITPDGRHVVSGGDDRTIRLWDVATQDCLKTIYGCSPGCGVFAELEEHAQITLGYHVLDLNSCFSLLRSEVRDGIRHEAKLFVRPEYRISCLAIDPNMHRAVTGGDDETLRVWDLQEGRAMRELTGHTKPITALALALPGNRVVSASSDSTLRIWDLDSAGTPMVLDCSPGYPMSITMTPNAKLAVTGSSDNLVRVWDIDAGQCIKTFDGHTDDVTDIAITPDGRLALSGSADGTLRLWDLEGGTASLAAQPRTTKPGKIAVTRNRCRVAAVGPANTIDIWSGMNGNRVLSLEGHTEPISAIVLTPDDRQLLSASNDGILRLWDMDVGTEAMKFTCGKRSEDRTEIIGGIQVTADGNYAAVLTFTDMRILDVSSRTWLKRKERWSYKSRSALTPDGRLLVCGEMGGSSSILMLYDCDEERIKHILSDADFSAYDIIVSADGKWCATTGRWVGTVNWKGIPTAYGDITGVRIWDLDSGVPVKDRSGDRDTSTCLALLPNGRQFVSGNSDGTIKLRDFTDGCVLATLEGHSDPVTCIDVSADGRFVVTASSDGTVRVWNLRSRKCVATYHTPGGDIERVVVRYPFLVLACKNGLLDFIELRRGKHDAETDIPLATAVRSYRMGIHQQPGCFDRDLTTLCPWCGRPINVPSDSKHISALQSPLMM